MYKKTDLLRFIYFFLYFVIFLYVFRYQLITDPTFVSASIVE